MWHGYFHLLYIFWPLIRVWHGNFDPFSSFLVDLYTCDVFLWFIPHVWYLFGLFVIYVWRGYFDLSYTCVMFILISPTRVTWLFWSLLHVWHGYFLFLLRVWHGYFDMSYACDIVILIFPTHVICLFWSLLHVWHVYFDLSYTCYMVILISPTRLT